MKIEIRQCRLPEDLAALTELLHRAYADLAAQGMKYVASHQTPEITEQRIRSGYGFIAEADGVMVGTITVRKSKPDFPVSTYREPATFAFGQFGVEPALRGKGIGRELHDHIIRFARANGATAMALDTAVPAHRLISLYAKWGYREVGRHRWEDTNYESVIMKQEIGAG